MLTSLRLSDVLSIRLQLDLVQRPSWQAQISGQKIWTLVPPPECEHVCQELQVTVTKGDISKSVILWKGIRGAKREFLGEQQGEGCVRLLARGRGERGKRGESGRDSVGVRSDMGSYFAS